MSAPTLPEVGSLLETAAPAVPLPGAEAIARDVFGLHGTLTPLSGERDSNFHLAVDARTQFVLKISHPAENPQVTQLQTSALLHVAARDPSLPVPRVHPTLTGETEWHLSTPDEAPRVVRMLSYLAGDPMHRVATAPPLLRNLGTLLARLDRAMADFAHPAADHDLLWDIQQAARLRPLIRHLPDPQQQATVQAFLDAFETQTAPNLTRLRAQVIHNDINPHNVLVDPANHHIAAGIIDFGDMVHAPLINNLAVAAAYHPTETGHPLEAMGHLVAGYHAQLPLAPGEIDLLFDLIATRMVLSVTISGWRAERHPENRDYILRNNRLGWLGLSRFSEISRTDAQNYFRRLCPQDTRHDHDQRL